MFTIILILILAYLIGSIPSGLIIGKTFYNTDIREHGSKNLGGTNTFRTLGIKAGLIVTSMDVLKGTLATLLPLMFGADNLHPLIPGVVAVIGHMYPIFARFKGGKAVATSGGILLGFSPILFGIILIVFFLTLYLTKYVSLSSMITSFISIIYVLAFQREQWILLIVVSVLFIFICYRHRANIKRIINKTEPKIKWL